ncbi:MAG TPA: glycerol-3-phosphate dehydrogenase/oxidase [Gaiellaceae bacterium]|nr:glycerol-3-phosphate dehydrogenase/oxidase [Gaiellaceae bacterium]
MTRAEAVERLARDRFDLCVVGGGIVGAGTAALAAQHGLRVALVERDDFASGTSSASSKLVHGGLRYLRMGDFRLVREALLEARALARTVAPHLVRPLPFLLPVYDGGPYGPAAIRAGLVLYDVLAGAPRVRQVLVAPERAAKLVPPLRTGGLRAAGVYHDAQVDDARLCLANVRAAADAGAVVVPRAEAVAIERAAGTVAVTVRDRAAGGVATVLARAVVNASGAAVDDVRRLEDARAGTSVAVSKGVHLVLDAPGAWEAALTIPVDRTRVSFAIPWDGLLLLGTTDSAFSLGRDPLEPTPREEAQVLAEAGRVLPPETLRPERIRFRFAGLRVLPLTDRPTAEARREVALTRGPLGVLSVAGGKLTTYRRIARAALRELAPELALHRLDAGAPLPGAADPAEVAATLVRDRPELEPGLADHLAGIYGSLAGEVLASCEDRRDALEPLASGTRDVVAQAVYARTHEWALEPEDVARRRTHLAFHGLDTPALRRRVAELWDEVPAGVDAA